MIELTTCKLWIADMIKEHGFNKVLAEILKIGSIIRGDSVGQLVIHVNNGGVTKICRNNWEIR